MVNNPLLEFNFKQGSAIQGDSLSFQCNNCNTHLCPKAVSFVLFLTTCFSHLFKTSSNSQKCRGKNKGVPSGNFIDITIKEKKREGGKEVKNRKEILRNGRQGMGRKGKGKERQEKTRSSCKTERGRTSRHGSLQYKAALSTL